MPSSSTSPACCLISADTDPINVQRFDEELRLRDRFDQCFYSNEMGVRKPDPEAYVHVSNALDIQPKEIAFFDDSVRCVNGAIAVGMLGHHVTGFGDLQLRLREMGILNPGPSPNPESLIPNP